jgi:hypothetical protein
MAGVGRKRLACADIRRASASGSIRNPTPVVLEATTMPPEPAASHVLRRVGEVGSLSSPR